MTTSSDSPEELGTATIRAAEQSGVFLLQGKDSQGKDSLVPMKPASFAKEADFQRLLSQFPQLLVGDQINPQKPRRWILVRRELPISTGESGASLWSIDHLFLDQEGIPTLVEVKRQSDSRIRREVVGQMLDYAANCLTYWSAETLRSSFEMTCRESKKVAETVLAALIGEDGDIEDFWQRVKTNLEAKKIRLLFIADVIPLELRRIVEFLNEQMTNVEVLAVELRQFESEGLKVLVPTVYGQTQEVAARRNSVGQPWDEARLFDTLRKTVGSTEELEVAKLIYDWMRKSGAREVHFGSGAMIGSVWPSFNRNGVSINPVSLSSNGKLTLQFGYLKSKPVFEPIEARRALMLEFNKIDGVNITDDDLTKYPSIPLATIARDPHGRKKVEDALKRIEQRIDQAT